MPGKTKNREDSGIFQKVITSGLTPGRKDMGKFGALSLTGQLQNPKPITV